MVHKSQGRHSRNLLTLALTAATLVVACSSRPPVKVYPRLTSEPPAYWPTKGWRASTPEQQGVDSESLLKAIDFVEERELNIHSLLVIRNGYIVADATFYPFTSNSKHDVASVTKSFTSTLIGVALRQGYIKSLQQPLLSFFPKRTVANLDADKRAITLDDLLTMRSGLKCRTWPGEITLLRMMQSPDWVQFMLDLPMTDKPATRFKYSSGGVHLLSAVISEATGMSALEFARHNLLDPMGISEVEWPTDPQGVNNHGWGDLKISPHDMAKLGFLYLHGGSWDGNQLLPPGWVEAATAAHTSPDGHGLTDGYGYLWWVDSSGFYTAIGRGGQLITVVPEKNMIVVFTAGLPGDRAIAEELDMVTSAVIPAAASAVPLPPNPEAVARLDAKIRELSQPRVSASPPPSLPETAARISGRTFACEPSWLNIYNLLSLNVFSVKTFSLTFQRDDAAVLRMSLASVAGRMDMEFPVGLDNVYRISPGRYGLPGAAKGFWKNNNAFVIDLDELGNINHFTIAAKFGGETLRLAVEEKTGLPAGSYRCRAQQ